MLEQRTISINGELKSWDEAKVHVMSHSFSRGSAIFEVISFHQTKDGPAVFRLSEHLDRLEKSAEFLTMQLGMAKAEIAEAVKETIRVNKLNSGFLKIMAYNPEMAFAILPPEGDMTVAVFAVDPVEDLGGFGFPPEGVTYCLSKWRKSHPETVPVEAKAAANYLNGMMSRLEARERGFDMAVMADTMGYLAEGGTESLFVVKDGTLLTPARGTILKSLTRDSVIRLADYLDIPIEERRIRPEEAYQGDEIFSSGTPAKVLPGRKFEERVYSPCPGPLTKKMEDCFEAVLKGEVSEFKGWLDLV